MKKATLFFTCFLFCLIGSTNAQDVLINYGANWNYYDSGNEPSGAWESIGYNDVSWNNGNAELGYGDGDEVTSTNASSLTTYFRGTFNVSNPGQYTYLDLDLTYDDSAVVYLNGTEVWRVNMPTGSVNYNTLAASTSSDNAVAAQTISNSLVTGINAVAVEIHQRSTGSSDISFDFKLTANTGTPPNFDLIRGPYLQKGTPTSIVVRWRTENAEESHVDYGDATNNLNQTESDLTLKTEHEIEITGLTANTQYYYQLRTGSDTLIGPATDIYFKTAPTAGTVQPVTAWI